MAHINKQLKLLFFVLMVLFIPLVLCSQTIEYENLKKHIEIKRHTIYQEFIHADSSQKSALIEISKAYLLNMLTDSIFPAWYNTPWNFNGHSTIPQKGTIACGYFITTTLKDAGFVIPRIKWAQMESERIIMKLTTDVKRFRLVQMSEIVKFINHNGDGLYIVGLDDHVGFISKKGNNQQFIHSSYYKPETGVMAEPLIGWNPLNYSKYRVIGKILDNEMIINWITGYTYQ